jgi:putative transposase
MSDVIHDSSQYANDRAEQAQRFLGAHAAVYNLFNLGRHLVRTEHYRNLREGAFEEWDRSMA